MTASSKEACMVVVRLFTEQLITSPEIAMFYQRLYRSLNQETCSFICSNRLNPTVLNPRNRCG